MTAEAETLIAHYHAMKTERADVEAFYICASMYFDPMSVHHWSGKSSTARGPDWNGDLYSGQGVRGINRFANFMLGNATPAAAPWLGLGDNNIPLRELDSEAAQYWADATQVITSDLRGSASYGGSFYNSKRYEYRNMGISYGVTYVYEGEEGGDLTGSAVYRAVAPHSFYYQLDEFDRITNCCQVRSMSNVETQSLFGKNIVDAENEEAKANKSSERKTVIQFVKRNPRGKANPRTIDEFPYLEYWVDEGEKTVLRRRGYYSQPFHVMGWYRLQDSPYYIGPAYDALPDMIGANAARMALIKAMEMVAQPPLIGASKIQGALKTLRPGRVTWDAVNAAGVPQVQALNGLAQPGPLFNQVADDEQRVANALFEFDMNLPGSANMSATEVAERSQQRAAMVAPWAITSMGSIMGQISRHYEIKARTGGLPELPRSVAESGELGIKMMGPLALAAAEVENVSMLRTMESIAIVDQMPTDRLDKDEAAMLIAERGGQAHLLRDPEEVKKEQQARAQQEQQAQQAEIDNTNAQATKTGMEALSVAAPTA